MRHLPRPPGAASGAGGGAPGAEGVTVKDVIEVSERQLVIIVVIVHIKIVHVDAETKIVISTLPSLMVIEGSLNSGLKNRIEQLISDRFLGCK